MPIADIIYAAREYLPPSEIECFVYQSPSLGGDTAAMCALMARSEGLTMIRYDHTKPLFDVSPLVGKNVVFADCAPTPEQYQAIYAQDGARVLVLDHHAPALLN